MYTVCRGRDLNVSVQGNSEERMRDKGIAAYNKALNEAAAKPYWWWRSRRRAIDVVAKPQQRIDIRRSLSSLSRLKWTLTAMVDDLVLISFCSEISTTAQRLEG